MQRSKLSLLAVLCLITVFLSSAAADELTDAVAGNQNIQGNKKEILIIESKIADSKRKIEQLKSEQANLNNQIAILDEELNKTQLELEAAQSQLDQVNNDITDTDAQITQTEADLAAQVSIFQENLNETYIIGQTSFFEVMVEAESLSDLVRMVEYHEIIDEQNEAILRDVEALKKHLEEQRAALEERKAQVETLRTEIEAKQDQVQEKIAAKQAVLNETKGLEENYQNMVNENVRARQQLEGEINRVVQQIEADIRRRQEEERQRIEAERRRLEAEGKDPNEAKPSPTVTPSRKGYIWPTKGKITTYFWDSYPDWMLNAFPWLKQGNARYHTGMDIAAPLGTSVVAPKAGKVMLVRDYGNYSYGRCVVIDHYDGTVTLYGHLSSFLVSEGQTVTQGQQIAAMGSTGFSTGSHLHFETRENGKLVDPLLYLP